MKTKVTRLMICLIIATTLASLLFFSTQATSWIDISPEEVYEQAEIIILGTYDFSGDPSPGNMIFEGYKFEVEKIYRGDVPPTITVGIDFFDVGWATDSQQFFQTIYDIYLNIIFTS